MATTTTTAKEQAITALQAMITAVEGAEAKIADLPDHFDDIDLRNYKRQAVMNAGQVISNVKALIKLSA